ncbi:MAG: hypothetical protein DA407_16780 [Bacteroidetes bacterium]|nr:MAG: hypothetical protein DA407_16780 [Bacteroidota bacterium]
MISIFKRIRKDLMEKNKTGKYFKYAIGEIVLVVIGILIALQINNWNEVRKNKNHEIEILKSFKKSIESDIIQYNKLSKRYSESTNSINYLINHLEQDLPYNDSLKFHFGNLNVLHHLTVKNSVFENLKSKGFDLLSNETLKEDIITFYDFALTTLKFNFESYSDLIHNASNTLYIKHFDAIWEPNSRNIYSLEENPLGKDNLYIVMQPTNYEKLKNDQEFMYFLKSLRNQQYWYITVNLIKIKKDLTHLSKLIDTELSK